MKTFLYLFLLILLFNTATFAIGDEGECKKCGQRIIICWDLNINTPKPVLGSDSILWKQLHYASEGYIKSMMGKESPDCLAFLPSCRIGDDSPPWLKPCPYNGQSPTETYNTDYELFGDISGKEGAYVLRLTLVTVKRERVASVTKKFEKAAESSWYGSLAALDLGGSDAGSRKLSDVIHEFEVKKRNAAQGVKYNRVALNASVKFKSDKYKVNLEEVLPIEIELKDCDDVPLKSALLELHVAKGRFENNKVETDLNGIAHALYFAPNEPGIVQVKVEYAYRHPGEKLGFTSDFTEISVVKPIEYLNADIKVNAITKNSTKGYDKVDRIEESKFEYETKMVLFICRGCVETLMTSPDRNNARYDGYNVVSGGSFYQKWDYAKSSDPVAEYRFPVSVKKDISTEGFRSSGDSDWGPLYTETVSHQVTTQAVLIYISPLIDKKVSAVGAKNTPQYVLKLRAPTIITEFGKSSQTNNGKVQRWDGSFNKMEDIPPPFDCNVPFVEDPFFDGNDEQSKVSPPVIDAKELEPYLLKPVGEKILNLHGTAFRPDNSNDYEITMDINIVLSPRNE